MRDLLTSGPLRLMLLATAALLALGLWLVAEIADQSNAALSRRTLAAIEADITALQAELSAPLTPDPLRHRIQAQITRREVIVQTHHDTQEGP